MTLQLVSSYTSVLYMTRQGSTIVKYVTNFLICKQWYNVICFTVSLSFLYSFLYVIVINIFVSPHVTWLWHVNELTSFIWWHDVHSNIMIKMNPLWPASRPGLRSLIIWQKYPLCYHSKYNCGPSRPQEYNFTLTRCHLGDTRGWMYLAPISHIYEYWP